MWSSRSNLAQPSSSSRSRSINRGEALLPWDMRAGVVLVVAAGCRFGFDGSDATRDSATGDGVPTDVSSDGPGQDGTPSDAAPVCLTGYSVCDGFESAAFDTTTWNVDPQITLDTTRAHRGTKSAH